MEVAPPTVAPERQENEEGCGQQRLEENIRDGRDPKTLM